MKIQRAIKVKKKFLLILSIIIAVIVGASFVLPIIYKDDINALVKENTEKQMNAMLFFDIDELSMSFFTHFPDITFTLDNMGVINKAPFVGDTLVSLQSFSIGLDVAKLISGVYKVNYVRLKAPRIKLTVLEDGKASYDITVDNAEPTPKQDEGTTEAHTFSISIDEWRIEDAEILYEDKSTDTKVHIKAFSHTGSGNFSLDLFELTTETSMALKDVVYDGVSYMSDKHLNANISAQVDNKTQVYTLLENAITLNDFGMSLVGDIHMEGEQPAFDIEIQSKENTFKSILSLVPAVFLKDYEHLQASGNISFSGKIKGAYTDTHLPAFALQLAISDAQVSYPDLPDKIEHIQVNLEAVNAGKTADETHINISSLSMDMGQAKLVVRCLFII